MSLTMALQNQDMKILKDTVAKARSIYKSAEPTDIPTVETVYGTLPITAVFDKKSKWQIVQAEYATILGQVAEITANDDKEIEIAKIIAQNPVLFFITQENKSTGLI